MRSLIGLAVVALASPLAAAGGPQEKLRALIIDGQNNHGAWPKTTAMMKKYLEETGLFTVDVERTAFTWNGKDLVRQYPVPGKETADLPQQKTDPNFRPDFSKYQVVVSNFGWNAAPWPEETRAAFEAYVRRGGGLVIVHAANNSFGDWSEYNRMIGLGGWGGRNEKTGPYVYFDDSGREVRDTSPGPGGAHGPEHEFQIVIRDSSHPVTRGLPEKWMHARDELYDRLRGPAENMKVLATSWSDPSKRGTGRHEPMLLAIQYGQGRVFHTPMGHADYSMECVGFIVCLQRGAEWAATGKVTRTEVPSDFPTADRVSVRKFQAGR
ncbi:MAG: ThuA domain-containing protein [Planctomycetota bacterium]